MLYEEKSISKDLTESGQNSCLCLFVNTTVLTMFDRNYEFICLRRRNLAPLRINHALFITVPSLPSRVLS